VIKKCAVMPTFDHCSDLLKLVSKDNWKFFACCQPLKEVGCFTFGENFEAHFTVVDGTCPHQMSKDKMCHK
jgi:hypothetical protein